MTDFKLEVSDVLVNINTGSSLWHKIKRWAIGEYDHCFMCMDNWNNIPTIFESIDRGIVIRTLASRYGEEVVVMRLREKYQLRRDKVLDEAIQLASDPQAYYDYACIPLHIIPRILNEKFGLPIPLKYHRNEQMVCSEAIAEVYWRAGFEVVPKDVPPLPPDFIESLILEEKWRGKLSEKVTR